MTSPKGRGSHEDQYGESKPCQGEVTLPSRAGSDQKRRDKGQGSCCARLVEFWPKNRIIRAGVKLVEGHYIRSFVFKLNTKLRIQLNTKLRI